MMHPKILLCSPLGEKGAGGITKWTRFILDYYKGVNDDLELNHFYPPTKIIYQNTPFLERLWHGVTYYSSFVIKVKSKLKSGDYNIVHLCSSASLSLIKDLLIIRAAHARKAKAIVHFRFGRIPELYKSRNWEYKLINKVIRTADCVIVIDESSYKTLSDYGYSNIRLVPNLLSTEVSNLIKKNSHIPRVSRKIVFAGHVIPTKGVFELIDACRLIPNIQVELFGYVTNEMKDKVFSYAGEDAHKWLTVHGEKSSEEVLKGMLSAHIFVLPTYTEGFPNVVVESMACGCPIITTPVGAIPEMLAIGTSEACGICVPVGDSVELNKSIVNLLENPELAQAFGMKAEERVNKVYSIDTVWQQLASVWNEIIN